MLICDYGVGDPAFAEVSLQLKTLIPDSYIIPLSVPPFSTLTTGFWIYQFGMTKGLKNTYIYSNTAPRKNSKTPQKNNNGEKLMYAHLPNGVEVLAINSGFAFSFIKPHIQSFHLANIANEGSQFRSRDIYPHAVQAMIDRNKSFLGEAAVVEDIPDYPSSSLASIDGYGNLKTTINLSDIKDAPGHKYSVTLNHHTHQATFTDGVFNIAEGELAFAPGSSGHTDRFMELFVRGGSAEKLFGYPKTEDTIDLEK